MNISIEMNLAQVFIIRNYYTVTDLLADIGGVGSILMLILSLLPALVLILCGIFDMAFERVSQIDLPL